MCDEKNCRERPAQLKGKPQECSAGQIITYHGDAKVYPCVSTKGCHDPAQLKEVAETCSPAQVRECHGNTVEHPCKTENKQRKETFQCIFYT